MVEGTKFGQMAVFMKVIGNLIRPMDVVGLYMQMEIFMMAIGRMIRHKVGDYIYILMGHHMMVIGLMINSMDTELKNGLMEQSMRENIHMAKNMEKAIFCGLINPVIKDSLLTIIYMVLELINGLMEGSILDLGN